MRLRELRQAAGMSQKQLADAVGITQPHLHDIEVGRRKGSVAVLCRIARALGTTVEMLVGV